MEAITMLEEMENEYRERTRPIDPLAPVVGGMRWRTSYDQLTEICMKRAGHDPRHPAAAAALTAPEPPISTAPRILSVPLAEAKVGESYTYKLKAFDGIATGFQWRLTKAPAGMTIDRHGGEITWMPEEGGRVEIEVYALGIYGGESCQSWTICVRKAAVEKSVVKITRFQAALARKTRNPRFLWRAPRRTIRVILGPAAPPGAPRPVALLLRE